MFDSRVGTITVMANKVCIYVGPLANLIRGYFYVIYKYTHIILVTCLNVSFAKEEIKENTTTIPQLTLQQVFHGLVYNGAK